MAELCVIIPALDEAAALPGLLADLRAQRGVQVELIVADGGSSDATRELAQAGGARLVRAPRGRARQMNAAAALAGAPLLLFLHADSRLPSSELLHDALAALQLELAHDPRVAGHFPLRFADRSDPDALLFRVLEAKTRTNRPHSIHGDQALLISREYFLELGGYDERLPFLEDQPMAERIFATGRWIVLPGDLHTSARRFEREGAYRRYTLMAILLGMHAAGVEEFFRRAPHVYPAQSDTSPGLQLGPYLALVRQLMREAGWRGAARIAYAVGGYVRRQSWQPFLWLDVAATPWLGPDRRAFLRAHDRLLAPLLDRPVADAFIAVCVCVWFLGVLPVGIALRQRLRR